MALFSVLFSDGFRKVIGAEQGGLRSDKDEWEFFNQNFQQRQPELLEHVKRKVSRLSVVWLKGAQGRHQTTTSISHKDDTSLLWQHLVNVNIKIGLFEPLELSNDDLFLN